MLMVSRLKFPIQPLVNLMLDQLPADVWTSSTTTFLDPAMGGGQFLVEIQRRLRAAGHSDENIAERMYGCETNILRVNYSRNNKKLVSKHLFISDFLSYNWGKMKFDVIVGNPPYQSNESKRIKPWFSFLQKSFDLLSPEGHVGMIVPNSWLNQNTTMAIECRDLLTNKCLKWVDKNVSQYFPVGETTCAFVVALDQEPRYQGQKIFESAEQTVSDQICEKLKQSQPDPAKTLLKRMYSSPHPSENPLFRSTSNKTFCNPVVHSSTETWYTSSNVDHLRGHNIIINNSGYYWHRTNNDKYIFYSNTHVAGGNAFQLTYPSKKHAQNALTFLQSKLYRFFVDKTKSGGFNATALYKLPLLDSSKKWTDQEVYQFFGLTDKEIEIVEKHCD